MGLFFFITIFVKKKQKNYLIFITLIIVIVISAKITIQLKNPYWNHSMLFVFIPPS